MGHNRSASIFERLPRESHRNGHHFLHNDSTQDALLHGELDITNGNHLNTTIY